MRDTMRDSLNAGQPNAGQQDHEQARPGLSIEMRGGMILFAVVLLLSVMTGNECYSHMRALQYQTSFWPSFLFGAIEWIWWAVVASAMWWMARGRAAVLRFSFPSFLGHAAIGCVIAYVHVSLLQRMLEFGEAHWLGWAQLYAKSNFVTPVRFGVDVGIYGSIFAVLGFLYSQARAQQEFLHRIELEKQLSQAQLRALQMQLEPHFLFNTLNAVNSLVDLGRNKDASAALLHLNTILRSSLQNNTPKKIELSEELRIVQSYLAIQQVRFTDRLQLTMQTTPEALEGLVPCFLLQPLVENAVQHGIAPLRSGGLIETSAKRVGDQLWIEIRDNGAGDGNTTAKGHGIGIRNTQDRLAHFYPGNHSFDASARPTGGYAVTIQIPFERAAV
jgi:Histidine kinase